MMHDDSRRVSSTFPDVFPISLSHSEFPYSHSMSHVDELGTPLGCIITPYIQRNDRVHLIKKIHQTIPISSELARCFNCQSYINPFCDVSTMRWYCSLCKYKNIFPRRNQKSATSQRYIKVGTGILPETQDILVDYPMPYRADIDGMIPKKYIGTTSIPATERPLIHIFLIQENMALDAMEAVIEGITAAVAELHPDIQVVLLSYSNRIGIHNLSDKIGIHTVQYIHMATLDGQGKIFEGNEMQDLIDNDNASSNTTGIQDVAITVPLSDVISFRSAAKRLGDCRQTLEMAISSIFDSEPINTDSITPQNHIGPVLQAVSDWVLKNPDSDIAVTPVSNDSEPTPVLQTISNIKDVTLNLLGLQSISDNNNNDGNHQGKFSSDAPIDSCSGVILNIFMSSKQDLPLGGHDSVEQKKSKKHVDELNQTQISHKWAENMGKFFCQKSLSVNIWAVTSFEGQEVGLWGLSPIANQTGGYISRCVLGDYPKDERIRFTKLLTKVLKLPVATKCIMKLRTSSLVEIDDNGFSGHATPDGELPEIFRIASCTPDEAFAFSINFKHDSLIDEENRSQPKAIILQVAFSYDTLVEDDQNLNDSDNYNSDEQADDNNNDIDRKYLESISEILSLDNESVADIVFAKSANNRGPVKQAILKEDGEYYNSKKRLVSVRRLRTITIMIECTPRMPRMIQVAHIPTIISLVTRQAIMFNNQQQSEGELILGQNSVGAQLVVDWAISIINSLVTILYKNYLEAKKMDHNSTMPFDPYELVSNAVKHLQGNRCLQVMFGAFEIMSRTCLLNDDRSDSSVELSSLLERLDAYHSEIILYPSLFPINKNGLSEKIPLKREHMITCAAQTYLLDSGYEMVYYQNISSATQSSQPPKPTIAPPVQDAPPKWGPPTIILNNNKAPSSEPPETKNEDTKNEQTPSSMLLLKIFQRIRLSHGIPRMYAAEAGTSSSRYLTSHLLEDSDYYKSFIDHIIEQSLQDFKNTHTK